MMMILSLCLVIQSWYSCHVLLLKRVHAMWGVRWGFRPPSTGTTFEHSGLVVWWGGDWLGDWLGDWCSFLVIINRGIILLSIFVVVFVLSLCFFVSFVQFFFDVSYLNDKFIS
jgi:hypothetical protein